MIPSEIKVSCFNAQQHCTLNISDLLFIKKNAITFQEYTSRLTDRIRCTIPTGEKAFGGERNNSQRERKEEPREGKCRRWTEKIVLLPRGDGETYVGKFRVTRFYNDMLRELEKVVHSRLGTRILLNRIKYSLSGVLANRSRVFSRKVIRRGISRCCIFPCMRPHVHVIDYCLTRGNTESLRLPLKYSPTRLEYKNGNAWKQIRFY